MANMSRCLILPLGNVARSFHFCKVNRNLDSYVGEARSHFYHLSPLLWRPNEACLRTPAVELDLSVQLRSMGRNMDLHGSEGTDIQLNLSAPPLLLLPGSHRVAQAFPHI